MSCKHGWINDYGTCARCEAEQSQIEVANRAHTEEQYRVRIADLQRQLAEAKALLKDQRDVLVRAGELLDKDAVIAEARAEIEAMRPVVGAAINWKHNHSWDATERLFVCITDYEARKQP